MTVQEAATAVQAPAPIRRPRSLGKTKRAAVASPPTRLTARQRGEALQQVLVLVTAFEEVLEYDPSRHHNQPRPALWVGSPEYIDLVGQLVRELRELNTLLKSAAGAKKAQRSTGNLQVFAKEFAKSSGKELGRGIVWLTVGTVAALLISLGAPAHLVNELWGSVTRAK